MKALYIMVTLAVLRCTRLSPFLSARLRLIDSLTGLAPGLVFKRSARPCATSTMYDIQLYCDISITMLLHRSLTNHI